MKKKKSKDQEILICILFHSCFVHWYVWIRLWIIKSRNFTSIFILESNSKHDNNYWFQCQQTKVKVSHLKWTRERIENVLTTFSFKQTNFLMCILIFWCVCMSFPVWWFSLIVQFIQCMNLEATYVHALCVTHHRNPLAFFIRYQSYWPGLCTSKTCK